MVDVVHPCRTGNPGTTLHACSREDSTLTLCGLPVDLEGGVNVLAGYKAVCRQCFPKDVGGNDKVDPIEGRG